MLKIQKHYFCSMNMDRIGKKYVQSYMMPIYSKTMANTKKRLINKTGLFFDFTSATAYHIL